MIVIDFIHHYAFQAYLFCANSWGMLNVNVGQLAPLPIFLLYYITLFHIQS